MDERADRPGPGDRDDDAVFAELIAAFDDPVDLTRRDWPEAEELTAKPGEREQGVVPGLGPVQERPRQEPYSADAGPRDWMLPEEDEDDEHFVPPEPPPLPQTEAATRLAWAAMASGPVLLLVLALSGIGVTGWWGIIAALLFVGGFVALVSRLKENRDDEDDDPQSGAVV